MGLAAKFSTARAVEMQFFLALERLANVKWQLVLGGFLGAAPIYSQSLAGRCRHYPARLVGGGSL
jgi:hypothetical protein